jgi:hypothetical protein
MVNTQESPVFLKEPAVEQIAHHDDVYTVQDGHFVGHDGFIVPNSFSEFFVRFPNYVADWVRRRVRGSVSATEAEDWTQELLLHLAALPACSKYRKDGKEDVIQTFVPDRMHGANEARFRSFINQCLGNKHSTLYVKWRKRPLSNPRNVSFDMNAEFGASDEYCHLNSEYLRQAGCRSREREGQRFRLGEFVRLGEASIPGLQIALEAFHRTGSWDKTAEIFGRKKCASIRCHARQKAAKLSKKLGQEVCSA